MYFANYSASIVPLSQTASTEQLLDQGGLELSSDPSTTYQAGLLPNTEGQLLATNQLLVGAAPIP